MPGEVYQLALIAAQRKVADDLRAEQERLLAEIIELMTGKVPTPRALVTCARNIARIGAIRRELENIGQ
jgi:ribosomal protein L29